MFKPPAKTWRADIEGLRGIAILLVVLYHAGVPGFSGGYIGVDVFFVLSGYLITGILVREVNETGKLNFRRFYARRARRLLPASALVLLVIIIASFFIYSPLEQENFSKTAVATAAYASNIFFGLTATDYLAADAETNPLLHTWSLAVEEQFYVVWPLLIFLLSTNVWRWWGGTNASKRQRLVWGCAAITGLSFVLMLYLMGTQRTHWAFFLSPARAWEFALGALAVLLPSSRIKLTQTLGWLGLVTLALTGSLYQATTPFPGWAALVPVLATAAVLRGDPDSTLGLSLAWRPLRELGRLSYSWYLWHWPLLVFAASLYEGITLPYRLGIILLSLGLAQISYTLVENPVRYSRALATPVRGLTLLFAVTFVSLGLSGAWWSAAQSISKRPGQLKYQQAQEDIHDLGKRNCHADLRQTEPPDCSDGPNAQASTFTFALFGDSHAAHWTPALQSIASDRGWRLVYYTKNSCAGIDATLFLTNLGRDYTECDAWRERVFEKLNELRPDLIIMSSSSGYEQFSLEDWETGSQETFAALSNLADQVVILRDSPRSTKDIPACLSRQVWHRTLGNNSKTQPNCDLSITELNTSIYTLQERVARTFDNVTIIDLTEQICPAGLCNPETDEYILYRDAHHLTASYVRSLASTLSDRLNEVLAVSASTARATPAREQYR